MDTLWSPWRLSYLQSSGQLSQCFLCEAAKPGNDEEQFVVWRDDHCFLILNRFPYSTGHLMISPYRHVADLSDLTPEESASLIPLALRAQKALRKTYQPHGFNMGLNLGASAGAGVAGHLHFHVVPRWAGDSNFMTVLGETRVIPEELPVTYRRVREALLSS